MHLNSSVRLLRVRFQDSREGRQFCNRGQLQNSLHKASRGFWDSFPSGRGVARVVSSAAESKQRAEGVTCSLGAYREATCRCEAAPGLKSREYICLKLMELKYPAIKEEPCRVKLPLDEARL